MKTGFVLVLAAACGAPPAPAVHNAAPPPPHTSRQPTGPYAPVALAGPFRSIAEWCAQIPPPADGDEDPRGCIPDYAPLVSSGPTSIDRAKLVPYANRSIWGPSCAIAIEHDGWWIDANPDVPCLPPPGSKSIFITIDVRDLGWRDVIRSAPPGEAIGAELVLDLAFQRHTASDGIDVASENRIICGTGASEHPSCTPWIPVHASGVSKIDFAPEIASSGMLSFHVDDPDGMVSDDDTYARSYPLVFQ
jgi:hypothetical protein